VGGGRIVQQREHDDRTGNLEVAAFEIGFDVPAVVVKMDVERDLEDDNVAGRDSK
jgi:hypothetical protein